MTTEISEKTRERIRKLETLTLDERKRIKEKCGADYEAYDMFMQFYRKDPLAMRKLLSTTSGSKIHEINFNIKYEKYVES